MVSTLTDIDDARMMVLQHAVCLESESVSLPDALDRVLAANVDCADPVPPFDSSAMDGFALRSTDVHDATAQPWPDLTLEECSSAIEDLHLRWHAILEGLSPEKLAGDLTYLSLKGTENKTPIQDVLMHLVLHSAYHRGQVAAAVREAGGKPAPTDYAVYLRGAKK